MLHTACTFLEVTTLRALLLFIVVREIKGTKEDFACVTFNGEWLPPSTHPPCPIKKHKHWNVHMCVCVCGVYFLILCPVIRELVSIVYFHGLVHGFSSIELT